MTDLTRVLVPCYRGRTRQLERTESLLNPDGVLVNSQDRRPGHTVLIEVLSSLLVKGAGFEATGIALKVMKGIDNPCNLINVSTSGFGLAVTRCPVQRLPSHDFETIGNPVKWTNSNTAKISIPYDGNSGKESEIAEFIFRLPYKKR